MHIPKTSGSALVAGLRSAMQPASAVSGMDASVFGAFQDFDTLDASRGPIYHSAAELPKDAGFVAGHMALSTLQQAYPSARRLTLLREPVARLLSHWLYWRQHTEADLDGWGKWADRVMLARSPLEVFLRDATLACQTDNMMLRMMLWPHPQIRGDRFIDPADDEKLVREALARLDAFDFVDIVENHLLRNRLRRWLGRPVCHDRQNETTGIPEQWRSPLHCQLTPEAHALLDARSRLDLMLWREVAARCMPGCDAGQLRERTLLTTIARYGALMG